MKKVGFTLGVCAYNEDANLDKLLRVATTQRLGDKFELKEIIVVASGCTDRTVDIVKKWQKKTDKIVLIVEKERTGKARAVNKLIKKSSCKYIILESADTIPAKDTFTKVLKLLINPKIGMVGCRIEPRNDPQTFMGFTNHLMWRLHHRINLQFPERPKVGEMVAFKKIFKRIPPSTAADEASIEPLVVGQGYRVSYCPDAVVYNKGPESVMEYLSRRRRNYAGHTAIKNKQGYSVITYSNLRILGALMANIEWDNPKFFIWTPMVILMESLARLLGVIDYWRKPDKLAIWKMATTSKGIK